MAGQYLFILTTLTVMACQVQKKDIAMFCSDDVKRGKTLYLSNAEYPQTVEAQKTDCMCLVRTFKGSEGINIHSIDVLLAWEQHAPRSCSKELAIKDEKGYRWDIQCGHMGYYGFRTIYTKPVQNVTLTLSSSSSKGLAFVWLQSKATDDEDQLEIYCGEPLRQILLLARQEVESRHRNRGENSDRTTSAPGQGSNSTFPYPAHPVSLSSNLAAIVGGIVAAGIVIISLVVIAITIHCKRVQQAKEKNKQAAAALNFYPAMTSTNGEATHLTSYCRYNDYDDDHYSSISRSPLKMASLTESDIATNHARAAPSSTKGFVTLTRAESHQNGHVRDVREGEMKNEEEEEEGEKVEVGGEVMNHVLQSPTFPRSPPPSSSSSPLHQFHHHTLPSSPPRSPQSFCSPASSPLSRSPPLPPPLPLSPQASFLGHHGGAGSLAAATHVSTAQDPLLSESDFNNSSSSSGHLSLLRSPRSGHNAGHLFSADVHDGHKTLPDGRGHFQQHHSSNASGNKILVNGPKSPLGKRSKSVTFSQPVAMVTPLPSGSDESMEGKEVLVDGDEGSFLKDPSMEDGNYDNLSKIIIPDHDNLSKIIIPDHPLSPSHVHTLPILRSYPAEDSSSNSSGGGYHASSSGFVPGVLNGCNLLPRTLSSFHSEEESRGNLLKNYDEITPFSLPPPPPPILNGGSVGAGGGDTYAVVHKKPVLQPVFHPQKQNAQLYETGV